MQLNTVRRAQFIVPFGPGSLHVLRNGVSVITAGLDHWYETNAGVRISENDLFEFRIEEWRLQDALNVDYFMLPAEFRIPVPGELNRNTLLTVPVLRFPKWFVCPQCGRMKEENLHQAGFVNCPDCRRRTSQVRFIAMCDHGHIQDFPWMEWVHRSAIPACRGPLRYTASGGGTLFSIKIKCLECSMERSLENVTEASSSGETTYLSSNLLSSPGGRGAGDINTPFLCQGRVPWHGTDMDTPCNRPIRAALRSSTNVYYAGVRSSIYLPVVLCVAGNNAVETLKRPEIKAMLDVSKGLSLNPEEMVSVLRRKYEDVLSEFTDSEIRDAVEIIWDIKKEGTGTDGKLQLMAEDRWVAFRHLEYMVLSGAHRESDLITTPADTTKLTSRMGKWIDRIILVEKLRETRVLNGFTRVIAENNIGPDEKQAMLWRNAPPRGKKCLPAYVVYGEGIFITLKETFLNHWEDKPSVKNRVAVLDNQYLRVCEERHFPAKSITPRFILLHTLAHLLMNRLTFECGYSSAAVRERLYVSANREAPMAGILIYTSSGDSEGTLGGLVRMAKPENFEPLFRRALEAATWCSADPVCSESGKRGGQGPDSCNLAACHCCCLVPETACEEFNRFLDRALVIDNLMDHDLGFFEDI